MAGDQAHRVGEPAVIASRRAALPTVSRGSARERLLGFGCVLAAVLETACGDATAPEEARFPIVEGIYNVETSIVRNSCRRINVIAGSEVFVFVQDGGRLEFRPPGRNSAGELVLLDLGIVGDLERDGTFAIQGTYTLGPSDVGMGGVVVGVSMEGRFNGPHLEGTQRQLASFASGSCEVTFSFEGEEV